MTTLFVCCSPSTSLSCVLWMVNFDLVLVSCSLDSLDNGFISCMDFDALVYNPRPLGMRFSL
jgi:hypothetical protein